MPTPGSNAPGVTEGRRRAPRQESLREQKKRRTREALARAAIRLFSERGYDETTVEEIATQADVSARTFFRYFKSKEDVIFFDSEELLETYGKSLAVRFPDETLIDRVRRASRDVLRVMGYEHPHYDVRVGRLLLEVPALKARMATLDEQREDILAIAIAEEYGLPPGDPRAQLAAGAVVGSIRSMRRGWLYAGGTDRPADLLEEAFTLLRRGLDHLNE